MLKFELNVEERKTLAKRMEELQAFILTTPRPLGMRMTSEITPLTGMATCWWRRKMQIWNC